MRAIGRILLICGILALFSLACQTAGDLVGGPTFVPTFANGIAPTAAPTNTFLPSPTVPAAATEPADTQPAVEATLVPTEVQPLMLLDDFSDVTSGWVQISLTDGRAEYLNGGYLLSVSSQNRMYWATSGSTFSNVRVEVDAAFSEGGEDNSFGLVCRYQNEGNFYAMVISADGYYAIRKRIAGGALEVISGDSFQASEKIRQGQENNSIVAECIGNQLRLYVNGEKIAEVTDGDLASGDVGMIVGTFSAVSTEVLFDNFRATEIE